MAACVPIGDNSGMRPPSSPAVSTPTGILLAAGKGTRFDPSGAANKLLAPLRHGAEIGLPVGFVAARRMRSVLSRVIAVIDAGSPHREALAEMLRRAGCEVVETHDAADGMGASLAAGVRASLTEGAAPTGWIVGLADMPMIAPATIQAVAAALVDDTTIAAPVFEGQRGHPVALGTSHGAALSALGGDQGARTLIVDTGFIAVDTRDAGVIRDVDRPDDLDAI